MANDHTSDQERPLKVFLSHASPEQDKGATLKLQQKLQHEGISCWCASADLGAGQHVEYTTRQQLQDTDVFIACLSRSATEESGSLQRDMKIALERQKEQPEGAIFFIPARLEDCQIPPSLQDWLPVNLYAEDGYEKLSASLQSRARQVGATLPFPSSGKSPSLNSTLPGMKPMQDFQLNFTNRELEKANIRRRIEYNSFVQVYAPAGLGKTWLLQRIQQEMEQKNWKTIWMDFDEAHRSCISDRRQFLYAFAQQVDILVPLDGPVFNEEDVLRVLGLNLSSEARILFLLDNADLGDRRMLQWIRTTFLETLTTQWSVPIRIVASSQQKIPEWSGHGQGRPFHEVLLSGFNDPLVLRDIVNDVAERFAARPVKERLHTQDWQADLDVMVEGLRHLTCEHPLAVERVLQYAIEHNGLLQASFFTDYYGELCLNCLSPIVGERILPSLDRVVREAFRVLCIFRYAWGNLIRQLTQDSNHLWYPFSTHTKRWGVWWNLLQDTHLISDVDLSSTLYSLSPIVRQIITRTLRYEEPDLYNRRHQFARQAYEQLLQSEQVSQQQRGRALMECWYHMTQENSQSCTHTETAFKQTLATFLDELAANEDRVGYARQLRRELREDTELRGQVAQTMNHMLYEWAIEQVEHHITMWKGNDDE